jgi:hypothetical protein
MMHVVEQLARLLNVPVDAASVSRVASRSEFLRTSVAPIDRRAAEQFGIQARDDGCYAHVVAGQRTAWSRADYIADSFKLYDTVPDLADTFRYAQERRLALGS